MTAPAAPPRWKMACATWLAIYPTITLLLYALRPLVLDPAHPLPLPVVTLVLTLIMVPLMSFIVLPQVLRLLGPWLRR